jgi:hypothetical protein
MVETEGKRAGQVLGYVKFHSTVALYLPVKAKAQLRGTQGWLFGPAFSAFVGRELDELAMRPIEIPSESLDRVASARERYRDGVPDDVLDQTVAKLVEAYGDGVSA